jgi:acetyltransferase-like isoleucine patch superfamily enzyme
MARLVAMSLVRRVGLRVGREIRSRRQVQRVIAGTMSGGSGLTVRGDQFPVQITVREGGHLHLGEKVFLNQGVNILVATSVNIGAYTRFADLAAVRDTDSHPVAPGEHVRTAPVVIGRNVWIGRAALVMPGTTIGDNSVVAAGAVVVRDVPPNSVVAGVPAEVLRTFEAPQGWVRP